jgi:aspartate aminotransferase-like enzyme
MHGKVPPKDIEKLLRVNDIHHDVYIIASQECIRSIAGSMFIPSKEKWEKQL